MKSIYHMPAASFDCLADLSIIECCWGLVSGSESVQWRVEIKSVKSRLLCPAQTREIREEPLCSLKKDVNKRWVNVAKNKLLINKWKDRNDLQERVRKEILWTRRWWICLIFWEPFSIYTAVLNALGTSRANVVQQGVVSLGELWH